MSTINDIYDPPPSRTSWLPPQPEPLAYTQGDLACLGVLAMLLLAGTILAGAFDLLLGVLVLIGGTLVVLESWFTALGFLSRRPSHRPWRRIGIILAALVPWVVGLGISAALMIALFCLTDLGA